MKKIKSLLIAMLAVCTAIAFTACNDDKDEPNNEIAIQIEAINDALDQLREKPSATRKRIGYKTGKPTD